MALGVFFSVSSSTDRATRIFILPSCILDMVGMEEGLAVKELCVKSRNSPADNGSFASCSQGVGAGVAGTLGLGVGGDGLCLCVTT